MDGANPAKVGGIRAEVATLVILPVLEVVPLLLKVVPLLLKVVLLLVKLIALLSLVIICPNVSRSTTAGGEMRA